MSSALATATVAAERSSLLCSVSFSVQARAEPGVMPRVLELFAKRGLVPHKWLSTATETALTMDVQIGGIEQELADYIARCMRQITGVETVLTVTAEAGV